MEENKLSFLVIGLGSMGKRRIRNLQYLGYPNISGFDLREDRCKEASTIYKIPVFSAWEAALSKAKPTAVIISVPPDKHHLYINWAFESKTHFFVEASVLDTDYDLFIKKESESRIISAPSCTLSYHPAIIKITDLVNTGYLGKLSSILYHSGQYLPDWHTYEKVSDYYVSNKSTGGAREILPFELTWLTQSFGFPIQATGIYKKTISIDGAPDIDDTYMLLADYGTFALNLTVDVVSRYATRKMTINGDKKQLFWNWEDGNIKIYDPVNGQWEVIAYDAMPSQVGYNKNITEQMYIEEVSNFVDAIEGKRPFRNSLANDLKVLQILYALEQSYAKKKPIKLPWTA
jgi:predicted dehydrogenase